MAASVCILIATRDCDGVGRDASVRGCSLQLWHRKWLKADWVFGAFKN